MESFKFEEGQVVKVISLEGDDIRYGIIKDAEYRIVKRKSPEGIYNRNTYYLEGAVSRHMYENQLEAVYSIYQPKGTNKVMDLIKSFTNLFVAEPQKSFMKVGVVDSNGNITADGQKVFITWLLKQNQDAFNTQVVQSIIAEQEDAK